MYIVEVSSNFRVKEQVKYMDIAEIRKRVCMKLAKDKTKPLIDQRQLMPMLRYLHEPYKITKLIKE